MSLKAVPTLEVKDFDFISKVDFGTYRKRLPRFRGEPGYVQPTDADIATRIPRVVGFIDEFARAQNILTSSMTNSVLVTGGEGVGKSALALLLLNRVALGDVSPTLLAKEYYLFNLHKFSMVPAGEQTQKFEDAMNYMAKRNSMIMIDRIDDFVADCGSDRSRKIMSSLINALENQRVSAFVTAHEKHRESIEQTSTLFPRRFEELLVKERNHEDTKNILRQMVPGFQHWHKVIIGDDVVSEVIRLDQRWQGRLPGENPNRLVEFLDQTAARVNGAKYGKSKELLEMEMQRAELLAEIELLQASVRPSPKKMGEAQQKLKDLEAKLKPQQEAWEQKFGQIRKTRQRLIDTQDTLRPLQDKYERYEVWRQNEALKRQREAEAAKKADPAAKGDQKAGVKAEAKTEQTVAAPVEEIPPQPSKDEMEKRDTFMGVETQLKEDLEKLEKGITTPHVTIADIRSSFFLATGAGGTENEEQQLLDIEKNLGKYVFNQGPLLHALGNAYRMREEGTADPDRPVAVIIVIGSPGSGKTESVEKLAMITGCPVVTFNMNDYIDKASVSKLVGAAPGLVGFGATETMPGAVRENPKCILFLDEIEKAHVDMQKPLMQVFDKGILKDEYGKNVNFKDTIIVMASNVLTQKDFTPEEMKDDKIVRAKMMAKINPETDQPFFMKPVVGRTDIVLISNDITPEVAKLILFKNIRDINASIAQKGYFLDLGDTPEKEKALVDKIIDAYFDESQGGRSIKQLSNKTLRPLATGVMLKRRVADGAADDDELKGLPVHFDGKTISIDGHTMESIELEAEAAQAALEPARPVTMPAAAAAAAAAITGGQPHVSS